jgi:hypothetical protein
MNEQRRMEYLEAMGVDMFTPRWVLPGAKSSHQCELPVAPAPGAEAANTPNMDFDREPPPRRETSVGALVDTLLQKTPAAPQPQPQPSVADVPEPAPEPAPVPQESAAFALAFWRVHPDVMVVDSRQQKALPTEALLQGMLSAVGVSANLPRAEILTWPMPGAGEKTWPAAREMVQAFLEGRLLSQPVRLLLVMGSDACKAVLGEKPDELVPSGTGVVQLDSFACEAIVTPSLADLLMQPKQKSVLWAALKPLRHLAHG